MGYHDEQRRRLEAIIRRDPDLMRLLAAARELGLSQWRVVAGCLYQAVWNVLTNKPARTGIRNYDLIYFDARDLSFEAEDQVARCVESRMRGLPAPVEVRNQARVHLWFKQRFGADYAALRCADEEFEAGLAALREHAAAAPPDEPVIELIDFFVFRCV
jgi:hypothetical protein